jgi:enoyl-CoA hydratase/carnithine racemase
MEMLLLGDFVAAQKAMDLGLVNRVVPLEDLETATRQMAGRIGSKAPVAIKIGKRAFYEQAQMSLSEAYAFAGAAMAENMMARDTEAGIGAFLKKEPMPGWEGE